MEEIARSTNMFDWIRLINDFFDEKFLGKTLVMVE